MNKNHLIILTLSLLLCVSIESNAQHFLTTKGKAIVNENQDTILLRGMGLGGWMVQEGYMLQTAGFANPQHEIRTTIQDLIGEANTDTFYDAWLANHARKSDIDSLKSWGFNSVRLPMHYNLFTLPIEDEPTAGEHTWLTKGFELTDSLISWCAQNEMYVILDLHAAPGGQGKDAAISDYDETKPSLWESEANRDKTVAFWKRIAARYRDEQWVAGYDLLNEVNWDLPGGVALKNLYKEITDSIRTVDNKHIIFIEGNWFANDFTGLTPPWDSKLVYSPHKYWSTNDEATMQWVIDLRNQHNVPLYLGESGENSNVWFRDAIRLLEDLDIGWAWWPMKKVESVACPLSITKSAGYQALLDYWSNGGTKPTEAFGKAALMQLTEDLKTENCRFQKDVIDAMFRQVHSDETIPFTNHTVPGTVHATDYDLGRAGIAYQDDGLANYSVSTGDYTAWNAGWAYRNDGVDIEVCSDNVNSNGYNVGFLDNNEWMQYQIDVATTGVYDIHVRASSGGSGGRMHFATDNADITPTSFIGPTGGWQTWKTTIIPNVILDTTDTKLRFYVDQPGFNISSFEFVPSTKNISDIATEYMAGVTLDEYSIQMNVNKYMAAGSAPQINNFDIVVNGSSIPITAVSIDTENPRIFKFDVNYILKSTDVIKITYKGNQLTARDGSTLSPFTLEPIQNTLEFVHQIPGKIQAEDFNYQEGISLETTTDAGGGENIGFLDRDDYLDYQVNINSAGNYKIDFRTAAQYGTGGLQLQLIDTAGNLETYSYPSFANTGGWQSWETTSKETELAVGRYTLRLLITQSPFNMNWVEFTNLSASINDIKKSNLQVNIFPNPSESTFNIKATLNQPTEMAMEVSTIDGQVLFSKFLEKSTRIQEEISLADAPAGIYFLRLSTEYGTTYSTKLVKTNH